MAKHHYSFGPALKLIEMGQKIAEAAKPMRTPAPREKKEKEVDVLALLEQKRREYLALKNFVEEQAKLNKPEKKEEKPKGWLEDKNLTPIIFAASPFIGAVSFIILKSLLNM